MPGVQSNIRAVADKTTGEVVHERRAVSGIFVGWGAARATASRHPRPLPAPALARAKVPGLSRCLPCGRRFRERRARPGSATAIGETSGWRTSLRGGRSWRDRGRQSQVLPRRRPRPGEATRFAGRRRRDGAIPRGHPRSSRTSSRHRAKARMDRPRRPPWPAPCAEPVRCVRAAYRPRSRTSSAS